MFIKLVESIPKGEVKAFTIPTEDSFLGEDLQPMSEPSYRFLVFDCASIPPIEGIIDHLLCEIAKMALSIWPYWFQSDLRMDSTHGITDNRKIDIDSYLMEMGQTRTEISKEWLRLSIQACNKNSPPYFEQYPKTLQAQYLAKAIHPDRLLIAIRLTGIKTESGRIYGLIRAVEWIASNTKASIALLVEEELLDHPEMSSALCGSIDSLLSHPHHRTDDLIPENKSAIWPIIGMPHPLSPGEQLLSKRLLQDSELSPLFQFNQRVETIRKNTYMVDLLWHDGRLIIEVDGYRFHSPRSAFLYDRQRDYEFTISGYRVLRLDHDEVIHDIELAVEKIRDVVRFCRAHSLHHSF